MGLALAVPIAAVGLCVALYGGFEWVRPLVWAPTWNITDPDGRV